MSVSQWRRRVSAVVAPSLLLISYLKHFQQDGVSSFPSSFDVRARLSTTKEGKYGYGDRNLIVSKSVQKSEKCAKTEKLLCEDCNICI